MHKLKSIRLSLILRGRAMLNFLCTVPLFMLLAAALPVLAADVFIQKNFANNPVPKWENGFLTGFEFEPQNAPIVFAFDRTGKKLFETGLALDGASKVWVRSTAASRDGRFAISGAAQNQSGARIHFIAFLDSSGNVTRVNRLEQLAARHLCFGRDGKLWVAVQPVLQFPERVAPEHDVLRVYSVDGEFKRAVLPRSSFAASSADPVRFPHPSDDSETAAPQLVPAGNGVVFMTSGFKELIRLSSDGQVVSREQMERPIPEAFLTGFAVAPQGQAYISAQEPAADGKGMIFSFFRRDPSDKEWKRLYARPSADRGRPHSIAMFEDESMLVKTGPGSFRILAAVAGAVSFDEP